MNSIKKILLVTVLSSTVISIAGQDTIKRKAFISVNSGVYSPTGSDFQRIYGNYAIINGISVGVPFINPKLFLYGKVLYFRKDGTGSLVIGQYIFNLGLQYNFILKKNLILISNAGITLINSKEESVTYNSEASGMTGSFFGVGLEKRYKGYPIAVFSEFQYNTSILEMKKYNLDYAAMNLNLGFRYYFYQ